MPDSYFDSVEPSRLEESTINSKIIVYNVLQFLGLVINAANLCTVWFSGIRRSTAWFSHTISWSLTSVGYLLIIRHQTGAFPGSILCLCQAMLVYALPALDALSFTTITIEIFLSIFYPASISRTTKMALYSVPYIVFTGVLVTVFILGRLNPSAVHRVSFGMFCYVSMGIPIYLSWTIAICSLTVSLTLGVCITLKYHGHWSLLRNLLIHNGTQIGLVLRVGLIGALLILAVGLLLIDIFEWNGNKKFVVCVHVVLAAFPAASGIIFASQEDILRVWMFWRKHPQVPPITPDTLGGSRKPETVDTTTLQRED